MSKMSNLAIKVEHKYSLKVGDTIKCSNRYEAEVLMDGLLDDEIESVYDLIDGKHYLRVTKVR